jgi:hypothetical protein
MAQCKASWLARDNENRTCTHYCIYMKGHTGKHRDCESRMFADHERNDKGKAPHPLDPPHRRDC